MLQGSVHVGALPPGRTQILPLAIASLLVQARPADLPAGSGFAVHGGEELPSNGPRIGPDGSGIPI